MPNPFKGTQIPTSLIIIIFDPSLTSAVTACEQIVNVQCVRFTVDGQVCNPSEVDAAFAHLDATTTPQFWTVDYLDGETTPNYQQNDDGLQGEKGVTSTRAMMDDEPFITNDRFKHDGGPFTSVKLEFLNFTWCMKGNDCNKFYEGLSWTYTRTDDDVEKGSLGIGQITSINDAAVPQVFKDAFDKFNTVKKYVPCS